MIRSYFQSQTDFAAYHPVSFFECVCLFRGKQHSIFILRKSRPLAVRALYVKLSPTSNEVGSQGSLFATCR